jgi:putative phosphoribosyl transferase
MSRYRAETFRNRLDAGRRLAERIALEHYADPVVLGLPRGGVPVAAELADRIGAPLDVLLVRKLGVPGAEEVAAGAIVDGASPQIVRNADVIAEYGVSEGDLEEAARRELAVIERRRQAWLEGRPFPELEGRTVIVVDDGIATGATVRAALVALRRHRAGRLVVAAPVAAEEAVELLKQLADDVIVLTIPHPFGAIGYFYDDFTQVEDDEVAEILRRHSHR